MMRGDILLLLAYLFVLVGCLYMCLSHVVSLFRNDRRQREDSFQSRGQELTANANTSTSVRENSTFDEEKCNELRMKLIKSCLFTSTIETINEENSIQSIVTNRDTVSCSNEVTSCVGAEEPASAGDDSSQPLFMSTQSWKSKNSSQLPFASREIKDKCSICLQGYEVGEKVAWSMTDECEHLFHEKCISTWLKQEEECPLCRSNILKYRNDSEEFSA